ncbi:predicted protein [Uncinocarpus reesii 1704]|uniref:STB6-like N-terminal domain-containing protein n=1 Tax=Uncinocarpus reesii (strain UAMH 1704) TaxID=336963 RepID=C4JVN3_UNCRE|nr:uncharacterized protein UREG_06625 [Uncinocarpus reesii 1704]EEP81760.1 predicted protein [Uncinocarpus reesii 1704]
MPQNSSSGPPSQRHTNLGQSASAPPSENSQRPVAFRSPGEHQTFVSEEGYETLVFTDPVVFRCLEEDASTILVERRSILVGYVTYIVEQWACSRVHPTFVINTYTGDPTHTVVAGVLKVPKDEHLWSPRLRVYFNTIAQSHTRRRETPLGILMVTNLSNFPSTLTVIDVPEGDVRKYREDFVVNENLKRLGCSGRAGLNLKQPTPATEAKFYQLYRTSERVPFFAAVIGLVKLCQMALSVFDKLAAEYIDGLLCDVTERAINDWWSDIGTELFNNEPNDGILGPTTVSALLGCLMGARNRLHAWGAPVAKDAFDIESLKRGIGSFQKAQKLERSRRLDRQTLDKLHRVTAKAASGEGWAVPRAVKSTVAELGGRGGEMVIGMVGGRDKAGISDIETLDMDRFVQLVSGERSKWLWHGKPRKYHTDPFRHDAGDDEVAFPKDTWAARRRETGSAFTSARPSLDTEQSWKHMETPTNVDSRDQQLKHAFKKSVSGKVSDARAGLGRFRDAVGLPGLRSHQHHHNHPKPFKDAVDADANLSYQRAADEGPVYPGTKSEIPGSSVVSKEKFEPLSNPLEHIPTSEPIAHTIDIRRQSSQESDQSQKELDPNSASTEPHESTGVIDEILQKPDCVDEPIRVTRILRRPLSLSLFPVENAPSMFRGRSCRHLSFSAVEESILPWKSSVNFSPADFKSDAILATRILYEDMQTEDERMLASKIADLDMNTSCWVERQVVAVESLEATANSRLKELDSAYIEKQAEYQALEENSTAFISKENRDLVERSKKLENLGAKLDYELHSLQSRVEEVENGLVDYEHHIRGLESRLKELLKVEKKSGISWMEWGQRFLTRGT